MATLGRRYGISTRISSEINLLNKRRRGVAEPGRVLAAVREDGGLQLLDRVRINDRTPSLLQRKHVA